MPVKTLRPFVVSILIVALGLALGFTRCHRRAAQNNPAPLPTQAAAPAITASNPEAQTYAENIGSLLNRLEVRPPITSGNLTVFPVALTGAAPANDLVTLQEALKSGELVIQEEGEGNVPTLQATVKTDRPMFLMAGEVIVGARQDRVLAHDVLLEPGSRELALPVYCVEPGRWNSISPNFSDAGFAANGKVRSTVVQKGSQGTVWKKVGEVNAASGKEAQGSLRQSYDDEQLKKDREAYLAAVGSVPGPGVVGAVVAIDGKLQNADVFASPALFAALWPKLSESYAQDALQARAPAAGAAAPAAPPAPTADQAREYLASTLDADYKEYNNPGSGAEFAFTGQDKAGSVILREKSIVHLAIFPEEQRPPVAAVPNLSMQGNLVLEPTAGGTASAPNRPMSNPNQAEQVQQLMDGPGPRSDVYKDKGMQFQIKKKP